MEWPITENCSAFNPPKINSEIQAVLSKTDEKKDSFMRHIQVDLGEGLSALASASGKLLSSKTLSDGKKQILPEIMAAGKFVCNAHFQISVHHRHQIYPELKS